MALGIANACAPKLPVAHRLRPVLAAAFCSSSSPIDPLVSTSWLARNLSDVSILDVRGKVRTVTVQKGVQKSEYIACYDDYLEGHIPGAIFFNWLTDGIAMEEFCKFPVELMYDTAEFAAVVEAKGVSGNKPVVVYDAGDSLLAPRLWWSLVRHGHEQVHILDGGFRKWIVEDRPTELYEPCPLKVYAEFQPSASRPSTSISCEEILQLLGESDKNVVIVDARDDQQYAGLVRRSKHAGRIPRAINIPRKSLLNPDGTFRSIDEQRDIFTRAGLNPEQQNRLIAYCNGGVASCTILLAWHRLGGKLWSNYDGSWNEWGNRDDVPIEL